MTEYTTDPSVRLSAHFSLGELIKSQTAIRKGIKNVPNQEQFFALRALCKNVLEPARALHNVPFIVTSGLRVLDLNRLIGSHDGSQHVKGQAVDFEPLHTVSLEQLWKDIALSNIPYDQIILEFSPDGWIHISYNPTDPQRGKITIAKKNSRGKVVYTHYTREDVAEGRYTV